MNNKKGFTLIELLAVIVILSIIMIVAVPNVIAVINKQEKNAYINDAKKLITMAKYKMSSDTDINYPKTTPQAGLVYLSYNFVNNGDINVDRDGVAYSEEDSFVVLSYNDGYLVYWVQLITEKGNGIGLIKETDLSKESAIKEVNNNEVIKNNAQKDRNLFTKIYNRTSGEIEKY